MSALAVTERKFQTFIFGRNEAIDSQIVGDEAFRRIRLGIYHDAYRLRLAEALNKDFEVLSTCLGTEVFDAMAREYLAAHPSTFKNLRWFGGGLAEFLATDKRYRGQPVLAELARLEWAMGLAFDAPDLAVLQFEDLAAVIPEAWPDLRFEFHPSVHLLALKSNAVAIWHSVKDSEGAKVAPKYDDQPTCYAVWRKDYASYFRSAAPDEARAIEAARAGCAFAEICSGMCDWLPEAEAPVRVAGYLRGWVDEGWIRAVSSPA